MNLAHAYAKLIQDASESGAARVFVDKLVAHMKAKGHLSLLPQVLRVLDRMPNSNEAVVTVKSEEDVRRFKEEMKAFLSENGYTDKPRVVVDPNIVGGFTARAGGKMLDRSFRSALVNIYQQAVRS